MITDKAVGDATQDQLGTGQGCKCASESAGEAG